MTDDETTALRSLRGCHTASARSVTQRAPLTEEEAEQALAGLVRQGRAKVKRTTRDGRKIYTAYNFTRKGGS